MNGYEVARRVRMKLRSYHVKVVALTGSGRAEDHLAIMAAGFDDHRVKPLNMEELSRVVNKLLLQLDPGDVVPMGVLELASRADAGVKIAVAVLHRTDCQVTHLSTVAAWRHLPRTIRPRPLRTIAGRSD